MLTKHGSGNRYPQTSVDTLQVQIKQIHAILITFNDSVNF